MTISDPHKQGRTEDLIKDLLEKISRYIRKKDDSEAATPEKTADNCSKCRFVCSAKIRAIVVFPHPGGPHKIKLDKELF